MPNNINNNAASLKTSIPVGLVLWLVTIFITILASVTVVQQDIDKKIMIAKDDMSKRMDDLFYSKESGARLETEIANTKVEMKTKLEVIDRKLDLIYDKLEK